MDKKDVMEKINPVFNTAKMTLYWLSQAGYEKAEKFLEYLHFDEKTIPANMVATPEIKLSNVISVEERHYTIDYLIQQSGCKNLLDLACGYTPRGVEMSLMGINYSGGDLPAVISDIKPMAEHFRKEYADKDGNTSSAIMCYQDVDITNYESVKAAADKLNGEICIVTEGLLMYLTKNEKRVVCNNIRRILQEHGGCWITQDNEAFAQFTAINLSMFGQNFMDQILKAKDNYAQKSDVDMHANSFSTIKEAIDFFQAEGLSVKRIPFYSEDVQIKAMSRLPEDISQTMKKRFSECKVWKMTVAPEHSTAETDNNSSEKFELEIQVKETPTAELYINLSGHLDTLTAPELLDAFEKINAQQDFQNIHLDLSKVQYISSAGLRVLLMMKKSGNNRELFVSNASSDVKEIFEMTGFSDVLTII